LRIGILAWSIIAAGAGLTGCANGGASGVYQTFMQKCTAAAKTEDERSNCAWENASRMASGG
jgi:hypothetical protein